MSGAVGAVALDRSQAVPVGVVDELIVVRMAAENGATRADLVRDLAPLTAHRLSPSELRGRIDDVLALQVGTLWTESRGRYRLSDAGLAVAGEMLGGRKLPAGWPEIRDTRLIATILGFSAEPSVAKALARPDGLRACVLQKAYGVGGKRLLGASRLRMALAVVALERAFGNKIKSGLDAGRGLSVKASRLLAGQLARRPRDFGTDTRLIAALAAEAVGSTQADPNSLRQVILRSYVTQRLEAERPSPASLQTGPMPQAAAPEVTTPAVRHLEAVSTARPSAANRPDLDGFAKVVLSVAGHVADGWPGNRKAFISRTWIALNDAHPEWGISEIEFKSMLAEAHRTGHVVLGSADIKNKDNLKDIQASAIAYKNTVWHFIRVEH